MLRRYKLSDYEEVNSWFRKYKGNDFPKEHLAPTGFIVPGIAVGFLIKTDANCCFLEPFIANTDASPEDRDKALTQILTSLISEAKALDFNFIFGISTAPTMIERALKLGFQNEGVSTLVMKEV